jgi:subtilisin family serine protease
MNSSLKVRPQFLLFCLASIILALTIHVLHQSRFKRQTANFAERATNQQNLALNFEELLQAIDPSSDHKKNSPNQLTYSTEANIPDAAIPNQRILRFASDTELEKFRSIAERHGIKILGTISQFQALKIEFENLYQFGNVLEQSPEPLAIEYNYRISIPPFKTSNKKPFNPDDYASFHNTLAEWLGIKSTPISNSLPINIAILDTTIQPHRALPSDRIIQIPSPNPSIFATPKTTASGHGTAVASIILGRHPLVPGIAPTSIIQNIPVLGNDGYGDSFTLAQAIETALQAGAKIINLSLSTAGDSPILRDAIMNAVNRNVFIVAASGNQGQNALSYPAAYPGVISVGAVDASSLHLPFSNSGPSLTLTAPGWGINAAWDQDQLVRFSGTSAAAPVVSAAIALLMNKYPSLTPSALMQMLQIYTDDAGSPGYDPHYGYGILNIQRLLSQDVPNIRDVGIVSHYIPQSSGDFIPVQISVQNRGTRPENNIYVDVSLPWAKNQRLLYPLLKTGQTSTQTIIIPRSELQKRSQIDITSTVYMPQWSGGPKQTLQTTLTIDKSSP